MENALENYVRHFRMIFVKRAQYQNILYLEECFTYWKIHLCESYQAEWVCTDNETCMYTMLFSPPFKVICGNLIGNEVRKKNKIADLYR